LILNLSQSGGFARTHNIIAELSKYDDWSDEQIIELCKIANENNQVKWIMEDEDVFQFYDRLTEFAWLMADDEDVLMVIETIKEIANI